ncbi:hypothetical protein HG531_003378 [Fusarium graminearum]|nr:hypothetical protein HG531_003378 [Fusarium graminearum]
MLLRSHPVVPARSASQEVGEELHQHYPEEALEANPAFGSQNWAWLGPRLELEVEHRATQLGDLFVGQADEPLEEAASNRPWAG